MPCAPLPCALRAVYGRHEDAHQRKGFFGEAGEPMGTLGTLLPCLLLGHLAAQRSAVGAHAACWAPRPSTAHSQRGAMHYRPHPCSLSNAEQRLLHCTRRLQVQRAVLAAEAGAGLVVYSGDLVTGFMQPLRSRLTNDAWLERKWAAAVAPAIAAGLPYAVTLGNHDTESSCSPREVVAQDMQNELSLTQQVRSLRACTLLLGCPPTPGPGRSGLPASPESPGPSSLSRELGSSMLRLAPDQAGPLLLASHPAAGPRGHHRRQQLLGGFLGAQRRRGGGPPLVPGLGQPRLRRLSAQLVSSLLWQAGKAPGCIPVMSAQRAVGVQPALAH